MSAASSPHPVEMLSALVDGEISAEERRLLERHLEDCASCARLLREMRLISHAAGAEEAPPLPAHLEASVKSRLFPMAARPTARRIKAGWGFRLPVAAAALFAGALALWVAARGFRGPSIPEQAPSLQTGIAAPRASGKAGEDAAPERRGRLQEKEEARDAEGRLRSEVDRKGEQAPLADKVGVEALSAQGTVMVPASEGAADEPSAEGFAPAPPLGVSLQGDSLQDDEKKAAESESGSRAKVRQGVQSPAAPSPAPREAAGRAVRPGALAKDAETPVTSQSLLQMATAENDRRLTLREVDGLTITLLESGHLRVEGPDYLCSVSLMASSRPAERPEVVSRLFTSADRALASAPQAAPPMKSKVAQPPPGGAAGEAGGPAAKVAAPGDAPPGGESLSLTGSNGTTQLLAGPGTGARGSDDLSFILDGLRQLALETHRRQIEEACGPLPGIRSP